MNVAIRALVRHVTPSLGEAGRADAGDEVRAPGKREGDERKRGAGPPSASRNAAIDGPAKTPRLSNVLDETFAAVSSSGDRASSGISADSAGRKTVPSIVVIVATT